MTCCTLPWLSYTHYMSVPVYQCSTSCSSHTEHTWPCVRPIQTPLAPDNGMVICYLPYAVSLTYVCLVHAPMGGPSPSPCLPLLHLLVVWLVWTTWTRLLCVPPLLAKLLLPAVFLPCIAWLLPLSIVNRSHWPLPSLSQHGCWRLPPHCEPSPSWGMPWAPPNPMCQFYQQIHKAQPHTRACSHRIIHIAFSSSKSSLLSGIAMPLAYTASAVVSRDFATHVFRASDLVGRVRSRMDWRDMLPKIDERGCKSNKTRWRKLRWEEWIQTQHAIYPNTCIVPHFKVSL